MRSFPRILPLLGLALLAASAGSALAEKARFVRIELPGKKRTLTLAEVEIYSGGKNVAPTGKATQSSEGAGGKAMRAVDGNKDPDWGKGGQTHTAGGRENPWWEIDLGKEYDIEKISIYNRIGFENRLSDFTLRLLDEKKAVSFESSGVKAPIGSVEFDFVKRSKKGPSRKYVGWNDRGKGQQAKSDWKGDGSTSELASVKRVEVPKGHRDPSPFQFQTEDQVILVGNSLADRMQHDGWTETLIQAAHPQHKLAFRNMSLSGDRVDKMPRSKGFTPMESYLQHVKADVILCFFGYNESFDQNPDEYAKKLVALVENYRSVQPNGESMPRIVLFSPIAHENLQSPDFPNGVANNRRLSKYGEATAKAAGEAGVTFVDLYLPSLALYQKTEEPLTLNGVHLNELGNKLVGEVIASALVGRNVSAVPAHEKLRQSVKDKNWIWHQRYRAIDGNDVWGSRSGLKFVDGQTNREVLEHELAMLDVMTANRDRKVWARANGGDHDVVDENVPAPIEVITNVGGGSRSSSAQKEGASEYAGGENVVERMTYPDGFEVNVFADEKRFPELVNPVQMQVDTKGRIWAAVWPTYPKWEPLKEMNDALMIYHDDDKDGVADRSTEFAKIHSPLGFEFWNGGVLVSSQPNIIFLKDTDGDDVADVRHVMLGGVGSSDTHHAANNLIYGPDGGIYWQSGLFLVHNHEHPWGPSLSTGNSGMFRFDPRRFTIAFHAGNSPNPHGTSFDYWGYHYATDGTGGRAYQVRPEGNGFKMHALLDKQVRPVPASEILSSDNFPDDMQGDFLICNSIGYLGVKHYDLHREGFEGKGEFGQVWGTPSETNDLIQVPPPTDGKNDPARNFRPTDAVIGEDGALYVADWHNVIIGHMQHNIRDPSRDHGHGRIYRMVYTGKPLQKPVAIDGQPITALLDNLRHRVDGVRHRTRVELSERDSEEVIAATKAWMKQWDASKEDEAHHLLEALWLHQQHNRRDMELLDTLLVSPVKHAAIAAATVKHHWTLADPATGGGTDLLQEEEAGPEINAPKHLTGADAEQYELGGMVFFRDAHCATCHQEDGQGMKQGEFNLYPPLVQSAWVTGSEERLIKLTLHGLYGEIVVNGEKYGPLTGTPPMTAFGALLDDEELAAVLTYVRNSWGNEAAPVKAETVKKVRAATSDRSVFWDPADLLKDHPMEK